MKGVNKGAAVQALISGMARRRGAPDFVLCFGDDELVFKALSGAADKKLLPAGARVFSCTVGQTPSKAAFYLDEPPDVLAVLRGVLATASSSSSSRRPQVSVRALPPPPPGGLGMFEVVGIVKDE